MPNTEKIKVSVGSVFFLIALLLPSFLFVRSDTGFLLLSYAVAFFAYLIIWNSPYVKGLLAVGLLARIGLFFSMPMLSDDVFRFLWDGYLLNVGIHPFAELPGFYMGQNIPGLTEDLFASLNSQNYFTVYPPINQGIFWLSVTFTDSWLVSAGIIRLFLLVSDLVAFYFLRKILIGRGMNSNLAFLYFLNPLIVLEGVGNLHFEVMVCAFLAMGLYYYQSTRKMGSGIGLGLAIGVKLLPLIYLPFFFFKELKIRKLLMSVTAVLVALCALAPMLSMEFMAGFVSSLNLYFTNFEFNGSLFAIAREISIWVTGDNQIVVIGPIFSIVSAVSILIVSFIGIRRDWKPELVMLAVLCTYLLFATTVHPWYILPLILFGILSGYFFPIGWSLLIFATYAGYLPDGYSLNGFWIVLEYIVVALSFVFNDRIKKWVIIS